MHFWLLIVASFFIKQHIHIHFLSCSAQTVHDTYSMGLNMASVAQLQSRKGFLRIADQFEGL